MICSSVNLPIVASNMSSLLFDLEAYILQPVDVLFRELSIPQIHAISRDFQQKGKEANDELHALVGNKYRDLIEIAEDVGDMYATANEVRDRLAALLFQNSKFINFVVPEESNSNKFELLTQKWETIRIKKAHQSQILNSLINNVLIKFNLKLLSYKVSPLKYTSNFIYYAKLFYTIERIFGDELVKNSLLNDTFQNLKLNFANYLEYELSNYNSSSVVIYSHDRFLKSQRLHEADLYNPQQQALVQLSGDELFDILDLHIDEDDDDSSDNGNLNYLEEDELKHEVYNRKLPPIVNYLISYIIIQNSNGDCITSDRALKRFIDLRYAFMELILAAYNSKYPSSANFDFAKLAMYLENTFSYVHQYFETDSVEANDLRKYLKLYTKEWNASDLFGFKNWIDNEVVTFDFARFLSPVKETDFSDFFTLLYDFVSDSITKTLDVPEAFQVFYNYVVNLKRLELSRESSILLERMQTYKTKTLRSLLDLVTKQVAVFISEHVKLLPVIRQYDDASLSKDLFTSKASELIYSDISVYLTQLNQLALSPLDDKFCDLVSNWFSKFLTITNVLHISKTSSYSQPSLILSHLMSVLENADNKWDYLTAEDLAGEVTKLETDIYKQLWSGLNKFLKSMHDNVSELSSLQEIYYYLAIVSTLEDNILKLSQKEAKISSQLNRLSLELFEKVILIAPTEKFISDIESVPIVVVASDVPSRPSLKLTSLVYKFNQKLLCGHTYKYGKLFAGSYQFTKLKNTWMEGVVKSLIDNIVSKEKVEAVKMEKENVPKENVHEHRIEPIAEQEKTSAEVNASGLSTETTDETNGTNGTPEKEPKDIATVSSLQRTEKYLMFANMTYLLYFARSTPFSYEDEPLLMKLVGHINLESEVLETSTADVITRSIGEYYKTNRKLVLPILQT